MMAEHDATRRTFMATGSACALALLGSAGAAAAADWSDAEKANVKIVTDFCAAWATRDLNAVYPFLAEDCVYRMSETTPAVTGHNGISSRLKPSLDEATRVQFRVLDTYAAGPIVINHRVDQFATSRPLTWEGVGVFFVKDGKIKEWSDYTIRVERGGENPVRSTPRVVPK